MFSSHGPVCPCCTPRRGGSGSGIGAGLIEAMFALLAVAAIGAARFVSGRVLWRASGPWDARWLTWAPPAPAPEVAAMRGTVWPRSTWARRPGWHRQLVRLGAAALAVALLLVPLTTVAVLSGAALTAGAVAGRAWHARRAVACDDGPIAAGLSGVAASKGAFAPGARRVLEHERSPVYATASRLDQPTHTTGRRAA